MNFRRKLPACLFTCSALTQPADALALSYPEPEVRQVIIEPPETSLATVTRARRVTQTDTARLLQDYPGVSLYGAGGTSSIPALHGLADERVRIQIDGIDLMSSCPNHMNPPLSLMAPAHIDRISVMAGITPVSYGGDSLGGTIQVDSATPEFAQTEEDTFTQGSAETFYRSNGHARGANITATYATPSFNLTYNGSIAKSENIHAASDFKPAGNAATARAWLDGDVIGSTAFQTGNQQLAMALKADKQLFEFKAGLQDVPYEQFPNQRMDLLHNQGKQFSLHYLARFDWAELDARLFEQLSNHSMNFGPDKQVQYGSAVGMPMETEGRTRGISFKTILQLTEKLSATTGVELLNYRLNDWWPPATSTVGGMGPDTFQNIHNGQRNRYAAYAEWDKSWDSHWTSQLGLRSEMVSMNTDQVQGYSAMPMYASDAAQFNTSDHQRTDHHLDLTGLLRYAATESSAFDIAYAQKTRSPSLYERYTWSASGMAAAMNNIAGDGNGYVGNLYLKPEIAHTVSASWEHHDREEDHQRWQFKLSPYITYVTDFIDAQRCPPGYSSNCSAANLTAGNAFVTLQYVNQNARLAGFDGSGSVYLGRSDQAGDFNLDGLFGYTRGINLDTHDNLYHIMPLNARLALNRTQGRWSNTLEWELVAAKTQVSAVRNEMPTAGYGLLNLRSTYKWKNMQLDFGMDNLLNRSYAAPLGGAYLGQGKTMGLNSVPWGVPVPGPGRSFNSAISVQF